MMAARMLRHWGRTLRSAPILAAIALHFLGWFVLESTVVDLDDHAVSVLLAVAVVAGLVLAGLPGNRRVEFVLAALLSATGVCALAVAVVLGLTE